MLSAGKCFQEQLEITKIIVCFFRLVSLLKCETFANSKLLCCLFKTEFPEKFLNIKCRKGDIKPNAVVVVATIRALKINGLNFKSK